MNKMSLFWYKVRTNFFPFVVAVVILFGCGTAWFLLHPASPYHERYSFVVSYEAIGTLSPGNRVEVRGITRGEITKVELTDDAVFVTARVLAGTKIPRNSEFRLITAGLMGEREMCVLSGDSDDLIADGDTVRGVYDKGTSGISKDLFAALESLQEIKDGVMSFKDSLTIGSTGKGIDRTWKKANNLVNTLDAASDSWKDGAIGILDKCNKLFESAKSVAQSTASKADATVDGVKSTVEKIDSLMAKVETLKAEVKEIGSKLEQDDNTAGAIVSGKGRLIGELDSLSTDIDALIADIKKGGLKLNVDIF